MGVSLRAPDIAVTHHPAHQNEILGVAIQERAEGVGKRVDGERSLNPGAAKPEGEPILRAAGGQRSSPFGDEERTSSPPVTVRWPQRSGRKIGPRHDGR